MEALSNIVGWINGIVWGPLMLVLILGVGFFLQAGLKFMPILRIGKGFSLLWNGREGHGAGQITPFQALMTSLSATIGTGNIAGVATAVFLGGPGALFWMWMTALVGMATKFAEGVVELNLHKQVVVDPKTQRTSVSGIWAAGDCTDGLYHQNNIAMGDAVKALEDIYLHLHAK